MSRKRKSGEVIAFSRNTDKSDTRREEKRNAKARDIRQRFAAARSAAEPKSRAAGRLKKRFWNPGRNPAKNP